MTMRKLAVLLCTGIMGSGAVPPRGFAPKPESGEKPVAKGDPAKKAILVVSFGTSYNDTRGATIGATEKAIANAYPDYEIRRAFTSQIIINKLLQRDGLAIDNVTQAMERLVADGVGTLIVQPTHIMNGNEYDDTVAEVAPFVDRFNTLLWGAPLLSATEDYTKLVEIVTAEYAPAKDTALVLMGHGTHHFANAAYAALDYHFKANGHANVFVGAVEGYPEVETVLEMVKGGDYGKVTMAPLMIVAGDHAVNDMAGDDEDSWKTIFEAAGYKVECVLRGLGEYPEIHQMYVDHIAAALAE